MAGYQQIDNGESGLVVRTKLNEQFDELFGSELNILYVGKHGNDSNNGKTKAQAFLTIGQAIITANAETPSSSNRFKIEIIDAGIYIEDLTIPEWVGVIGLASLIQGNHTLADNTALWAFRLVATTGTCITKSAGVGDTLIRAERMILTGSANGTLVTAGEIVMEVGIIEVENGFGVGSTSTSDQVIIVDAIRITGTGIGTGGSGSGNICLRANCITDDGSGTGIQTLGTYVVNAVVNRIECNTAYIEGINTSINLTCTNLSGTETKNGNGAIVVNNNVALLDQENAFSQFPVTPSSSPSTDYQVSNKKYVDDTILPVSEAVTKTGSNCLTLNGTNNYIQIGDYYCPKKDFTISMWVKRSRNNTEETIASHTRSTSDGGTFFGIRFEADNTIKFNPYSAAGVDGRPQTTETYTTADGWIYLEVGHSSALGTSGKCFIRVNNGATILSTSDVVELLPQTVDTSYPTIGAYDYNKTLPFQGQIAGFKVVNGITNDVILHIPLAEGSGNVAYDVSGNDNHGTIKGTLTNVWDNTQDNFHYNNDYGCSKAMKFNGTNNYISVTDNAFNVSDVSATPFEIRFSVNLTEDVLAGSLTSLVTIGTADYNTLHIGVETTNKIRVIYSIDGSAWTIHLSSTALSSGWNDIVITRDISGNYIVTSNRVTYLDFTDANDILLNNYEMHIGAHYSLSAAYYFHDELFNFDFKVNDISVAKYSGIETDLWTDLSGNSNDGTVNGTTPVLIYIPALTDLTENAIGGEIQNPPERSGTESNGSETTVELVVTMEADAYNFKAIELTDSTKFFKPNSGTTAQRLALTGMSGGEEYYDTDLEAKFLYNATLSAWVEV